MNYETEQALRVKSLAMDTIEELMKDNADYGNKELKQLSELFARCICDLVNVYTNLSEDHEMTLKATIVKAKVGYNLLNAKTKQIKE